MLTEKFYDELLAQMKILNTNIEKVVALVSPAAPSEILSKNITTAVQEVNELELRNRKMLLSIDYERIKKELENIKKG